MAEPVFVGMVAPQTTASVRALEELGVDSLWVGGHLASARASPEPLVWLACLAEQSERATIGTATLVLPWYPPAVAAKQLADIDRASDGRLVVGVGAGGEYPDDFAAAGVPIGERGARLDESIGLLRRFWAATPVDYAGRHFSYANLRIHPPPVQPGGPPIVITGRRTAAIRRAATLGDGWMPYLYTAERYAESVAAIRDVARGEGRSLDSFLWMAYVMVSVDTDPEVAGGAPLGSWGAPTRKTSVTSSNASRLPAPSSRSSTGCSPSCGRGLTTSFCCPVAIRHGGAPRTWIRGCPSCSPASGAPTARSHHPRADWFRTHRSGTA